MLKKNVVLFLLLMSSCGLSAGLSALSTKKEPDSLTDALEPGQFLLDEIIVTAYGPERTRVICRSEVERLGIDGRKRSIEDLVFEELLFQETIRMKIPMDESVVDKYIMGLRKEHQLSLDDVKGIFSNSGYTYEEGREQLRLMYAANSLLEHKISSRLIVPRDDVLKYYNDHPEVKKAKYQLQMSFVPFQADENAEKQIKSLTQKVKQGGADQLVWRTPFWLKEDEISDAIQFVKKMKTGDVSQPQLVDGGFELYRVAEYKPERIIPLERRYKAIEDELRIPRYQKLLAEYKDQVFKKATVIEYVAPDSIA